MLTKEQIPNLVKHTVLAVFVKSKSVAKTRRGFLDALSIARASLTKAGYLVQGSDLPGIKGDIRLTRKGIQRDRKHSHQVDRGYKIKSQAFDALFDAVVNNTTDFQEALSLARKAARYSSIKKRKKPGTFRTRTKTTKKKTRSPRKTRTRKVRKKVVRRRRPRRTR